MNNIYILIVGMMIVTYLPRLLPFLVLSNKEIPSRVEEFLGYIPFAALGALIVPGFITAIPHHQYASIVGLIIAFILGYIKGGVVIPVTGAILSCVLLITLGM